MINAEEARKNANDVVDKVKDTKEYKTAMYRIEEHIKDAMLHGETSMSYNMCAMCEGSRGYPSSAVRKAVQQTLNEHGFSYREMSVMNIRGDYNSCFEVRW